MTDISVRPEALMSGEGPYLSPPAHTRRDLFVALTPGSLLGATGGAVLGGRPPEGDCYASIVAQQESGRRLLNEKRIAQVAAADALRITLALNNRRPVGTVMYAGSLVQRLESGKTRTINYPLVLSGSVLGESVWIATQVLDPETGSVAVMPEPLTPDMQLMPEVSDRDRQLVAIELYVADNVPDYPIAGVTDSWVKGPITPGLAIITTPFDGIIPPGGPHSYQQAV